MKPTFRQRLLLASISLVLSATSAYSATETYNTAGTFDWVCPGGVTSIQVECWGGGGAGGAGRKDTTAGTNTSQNGGGGGGGAYASRTAVPVTPGQTYTITIPAAAVSGSAGTTTSGAGRVNGGTVTFVGDSGTTVSAAGGTGGANAYTTVNGTVGAGGGAGATTAASIGDVTFAGGVGSAGNTGATNVSGSGGGGAGDANAGGAAVTTTSTTTAGAGGIAGGGAGGAGRSGGNTNAGVGAPGTSPGGGGGGGHNQGISTRLGGTGGLGQMVINYTIPPNFKANNETALNDPSSWTAFLPSGGNIAEWNNLVTGANTTSLGDNLTFSGIRISDPGGLVTINADPGDTLTLGGAAIDIDLSASTQDLTMNCDLALGAANVWNVASTKTLTLGGVVSGSSTVTKQGAGTVVLSGASTYTGNTAVSGGTLNVTGTLLGNNTTSTLAYGGTAANTVVNVSNDITLAAITGANIAGSSAVYNQTAGTVTTSPVQFGDFVANNGGYGYFNLTGGTFKNTSGSLNITNNTSTASNGVAYLAGNLDLSASTGNMVVAYSASSTASLTVAPGGTLNYSGAGNTFFLTVSAGSYGVLNVAGGNVDFGTRLVRVGNAGAGQTGLLNLAGGTFTLGKNFSTVATTSNFYVNCAGGTLKAAADLTSPFTAGAGLTTAATVFGPIDNVGTSQDFAGGLTVDTNGNSVTLDNALGGAAGNGVKQSDISISGGSGYIGAPQVIFTGGTLASNGTPASGYALISGGSVTGIVITAPGCYTSDPTVSLTGGGGSGASVTLSALTANPADLGLTKIGAGSLTLSGANTYAGGTAVNDGALKFATAVAAATNVTVADGAEGGVFVGVNDAQWINTGNLTLQNNGAAVIDYGSTAPSITTAPISVTDFVVGTTPGVRLTANPASAILVGQPYPLVTWTGSGPADGPAAFTSLTHRLVGNFNVSTDTLYFTATSNTAGSPISWNTGDGTWDNSAVNWLDASLTSTTYFDTLDAVLFGDASGASGNPSITLGSSVSPVSVTMNSSSHDYTVSGAGSIGGSGALTLDAANTRTFTLSTANNSFTGGTSINGGTLALGDATNTLPDTGAVTVDGASAILSLGANSDTVGAVSLKNGASITGSGTLTGTSYALESGDITPDLGGSGGLTKTTAGASTLSGDNSYAGTTTVNGGTLTLTGNNSACIGNTNIGGGTVVAANVNALNLTGIVAIATSGGSGTLRLATDTSVAAFPLTTSSNNPGTIIVDRATEGAGFTHVLGPIILANNVWTIEKGANVTSGTAVVSFASGNLSAGATGTCTLNPTTASVVIPGAVNIGNNNFAKTLALSGESTGNEISGVISNGLNTVTITKSGTSTWTLSGENTYTGATSVSQGTLILSGARTGTSGALSIGTVAGQDAILNITNGTYALGGNSINVANSTTTAASGTVNQSGGDISFTGGNALLVGQNTVGNTGTYNLSGGSITTYASATRGIMIGVNTSTVGNTTGIFNLSGSGVLNMTAASGGGGDAVLQVGRFDSAANDTIASFNQTGGTANVGILSIGGNGATGTGIASTMSLTGGTFTANQFARLALGNTNSATITIGGTAQVTLPAFPLAHGTGSTATITFDSGASGYLRPLASSTTYMQAATFNDANLTASGARFDTNGFDITIGQVLQNAPSVAGTLTKSGAGILTLSGANTYTGNTVVNAGTLELAPTGQLKFVLGATSGVSNSITGTDALLKGSFIIDTTAADSLSEGTWTLENITSLTGPAGYDATFTVSGFSDAGNNQWTKTVSGKTYTFDETTGTLELSVAGGYASWASTNAPTGTADDDFDGDGVSNGAEYVLGGDKDTNDLDKLPTLSTSGGNLVFTFERDQASIDGSTVVTIEVGTTLNAWPSTYSVPDGAVANNPGVTVVKDSPTDFDTVTLTVPQAPDAAKFARLKVTVAP